MFSGLNTESSFTLILPSADVTVTNISGFGAIPPGTPGSTSGDVGIDAVTSAIYGTYQASKDIWLGIGINSPFGLMTKPDNTDYFGRVVGVTTKLLTINATPTIAYRIAPGITVGAGVQIEWARAKLQFGEGLSPAPIAQFKGTDWAVGATAGILLEPTAGTSIGLGYRSNLSHEFSGRLTDVTGRADAEGFAELPELVTLSIRQEITPITRLLGTVEWTNWSRFEQLTLKSIALLPATGSSTLNVPANWSDGWFFSIGGEYDYSPVLTLRTGVAYELSPEDDATKRFTTIPDNNRVWLSIGGAISSAHS
jgi:long-chain fatty acid transport protein